MDKKIYKVISKEIVTHVNIVDAESPEEAQELVKACRRGEAPAGIDEGQSETSTESFDIESVSAVTWPDDGVKRLCHTEGCDNEAPDHELDCPKCARNRCADCHKDGHCDCHDDEQETFTCPLCHGDDPVAYIKAKGTHTWSCPSCPFVAMEFYTMGDAENLSERLENSLNNA